MLKNEVVEAKDHSKELQKDITKAKELLETARQSSGANELQ